MSATNQYSLSQLLGSVRRCLEAGFAGSYWIQAETSDLRRTGGTGHCYMELLEKAENGSVLARVRANVWSTRYNGIVRRFIDAGLDAPSSGMKILALVRITFHEQYGLSLDIQDIDVNYSLGEIARLRQQTIQRLKAEGIWGLNKALSLGRPLQRLAIISSSGAAGYGDFMKHLRGNRFSIVCYTALFPALMQGERTTESILRALDSILQYQEHFDAVVIIRGGGAVSELRAFDMYELCAACAQFPLPIITGIGHERDESVLDLVAHTSLKTPTAVADFVIGTLHQELEELERQTQRLTSAASLLSIERDRWLRGVLGRIPVLTGRRLTREQQYHNELQRRVERQAHHYLHQKHQQLSQYSTLIPVFCRSISQSSAQRLSNIGERLRNTIAIQQQQRRMQLHSNEQIIKLSHPKQILKRGFAVVKRHGEFVKTAANLTPGEHLSISLQETEFKVEILELNKPSQADTQ